LAALKNQSRHSRKREFRVLANRVPASAGVTNLDYYFSVIFSLFSMGVLGIMAAFIRLCKRRDSMTDQIKAGIELMFAGMGIVFLFLIVLVFVINIMSAFVQRFFPDTTPGMLTLPGGIDKSTVAAITAAIHQYRNKRH
jgi:oxaloacetate decarboxylase (Na+ extruding) subunit gamma